jgi:hypothetical protein
MNFGKNVEKGSINTPNQVNVKCCVSYGRYYGNPPQNKQIKVTVWYDSTTPLLGIYPRK